MFGLDGLFSMIGNAISAAINRKAQDQTNQVQKEIAAENNATQMAIQQSNVAMQRETNAMQVSENEKAYQRSTIDAQIKQFTDAGYSEFEARRLVAGAAAGQYQPATMTAPQMDGSGIASGYAQLAANYRDPGLAMAQDVGNAVSALGSVGSELSQSFSAEDGGAFGAMISNDLLEKLSPHLADIPDEARSWESFQNYLQSGSASDALKKIAQSDEYKRVVHSILGRKFMHKYFTQSFEFTKNVTDLHRERIQMSLDKLNVQRGRIAISKDNEDVRTQQLNNALLALNLDTQSQIHQASIESALQHYELMTSMDSLQREKFEDPEYRVAWLLNELRSAGNAAIMSKIVQSKLSGSLDWMNVPENARFAGIMEIMQSCGMTDNDYTAAAAIIAASTDPEQFGNVTSEFGAWVRNAAGTLAGASESTRNFVDRMKKRFLK